MNFILPERVRTVQAKDLLNPCNKCGSSEDCSPKKPRRSSRKQKIRLRNLNPFITCGLCHGYLVDATSITECLHSFCKSCILQYFDTHNRCPTCNLFLHHSYPKNYLNPDRTKQDIVYKVVPGLKDGESAREKDFYKSRGIEPFLPLPSPAPSPPAAPHPLPDHTHTDEEVQICLKSMGRRVGKVRRRYVKVTGHATIGHLQKYLAIKIFDDPYKDDQLELLCDGDVLSRDHTLKNIRMTKWPFPECPVLLHFRLSKLRIRRKRHIFKTNITPNPININIH